MVETLKEIFYELLPIMLYGGGILAMLYVIILVIGAFILGTIMGIFEFINAFVCLFYRIKDWLEKE